MLGTQQQVTGLGYAKEKQSYTNCVSRALYDNVAEAPDELAFRRGDLLTVLEQNPNGLEGWWLCSLKGRQGIAPGNRLRLLPGVYDPTGLGYGAEHNTSTPRLPSPASPMPPPTPQTTAQTDSTTMPRRRSWHLNPNKVVMPQRVGDVYLYDVPQGTPKSIFQHPSQHRDGDLELDAVVPLSSNFRGMKIANYDVPLGSLIPVLRNSSYDTPPSPRLVKSMGGSQDGAQTEAYDVPRPTHDYDLPPTEYDIPAAPRLITEKTIGSGAYDIPPSKLMTTSDNYVVPPSQLQKRPPGAGIGIPVSNRSSGVSLISAGSPSLSPACSQGSLNASLSLSSFGGSASNRSSLEHAPGDLYDIPASELRPVLPPMVSHLGITPNKNTVPSELYDVPTNNSPASMLYDTPPAPRATTPKGLEEIYDVPPQVTKDTPAPTSDVLDGHRLSFSGAETVVLVSPGKELRIQLDAAMEVLSNVHQQVAGSITKLFGFVSSTWRQREEMETRVYEIKATCHRLKDSLKEFLNFAQGALSNSTHALDKSLSHKLNKLIQPLVDSESIVSSAVQSLDDKNWPVVHYEENSPDELDQLVACARGLVEDVRQVSSFIQGNSTLIFKRSPMVSDVATRSNEDFKPPIAPKPRLTVPLKPADRLQERPLPPVPGLMPESKDETEFPNDYDYVNLESKESAEKKQEEMKASLPCELVPSFETLVKQSQVEVAEPVKSELALSDAQLLAFYNQQMVTHRTFLNNAIDSFLETVKTNQPPKVFINHSKFVVISVYKLLYIGDTVQRNVLNMAVKSAVGQNTNSLCSSSKALVANVKKAALQFPSVEAVQQMVDSVVDVSNLAKNLQTCLVHASLL